MRRGAPQRTARAIAALLVGTLVLGACGAASDTTATATASTAATTVEATTTSMAPTATTAEPPVDLPTSLDELTWGPDGLASFPWGSDRDEVIERLTAMLGPAEHAFDDVGVECGLDARSMRSWQDPHVFVGFDHEGRLAAVSFPLDSIAHETGKVEADMPLVDFVRIQPGVGWGGPFDEVGDGGGTYYDWTLVHGDTTSTGSVTGPPPDGRIGDFVHLSGPYESDGCGE